MSTDRLEKTGKMVGRQEEKAVKRVTGKTMEQPGKQTAEQPERQVTEQPEKQTAEQPERQVTEQPERQTAEQPEKQVAEQPERQTAEQPEKSAQQINQPVDSKRRRTVTVLLIGAIICAAITGFLLFDYHKTSLETDRALEAMRLEGDVLRQETLGSDIMNGSLMELPAIPEEPGLKNPYADVFQEYPDIKGWLRVEGTQIDYPILQREGDDEYYLFLNFKGEEDKRGSLILDEDSSTETGAFTTNLLIHGHNMKDGSMFGELDGYKSKEFYEEHKYMELYAEDGRHEYEVIAVFESRVFYVTDQVFKYYNFFQADTTEEFNDYYNNIKGLSLYETGVTAEYGDKFLTLSTCAYHVEDGRFVVVAREIK